MHTVTVSYVYLVDSVGDYLLDAGGDYIVWPITGIAIQAEGMAGSPLFIEGRASSPVAIEGGSSLVTIEGRS